jgi:hypothetical protein
MRSGSYALRNNGHPTRKKKIQTPKKAIFSELHVFYFEIPNLLGQHTKGHEKVLFSIKKLNKIK